jgi:hypothetical protein
MAHLTQWLLLSASSVPCSVYRSFADFEWAALWKSKVEFFCWLILQNKLWTADRITKYGGTTNTVCQLCRTKNESALHMMAKCSYSKTIWTALASWIGTHFRPPPRRNYRRLQTWWRNLLRRGGPNAVERRDRMQKVIYIRNRTLTLIEREDDTRSWENFLIYFSHSTTMSYPLRGWGYILIGC